MTGETCETVNSVFTYQNRERLSSGQEQLRDPRYIRTYLFILLSVFPHSTLPQLYTSSSHNPTLTESSADHNTLTPQRHHISSSSHIANMCYVVRTRYSCKHAVEDPYTCRTKEAQEAAGAERGRDTMEHCVNWRPTGPRTADHPCPACVDRAEVELARKKKKQEKERKRQVQLAKWDKEGRARKDARKLRPSKWSGVRAAIMMRVGRPLRQQRKPRINGNSPWRMKIDRCLALN